MSISKDDSKDERLLSSLAIALVAQPRASLQELALAVGVGKTTLHRFYRTREQLIERLMKHTVAVLGQVIGGAELTTLPPREALCRLNSTSLEHNEFTSFLVYYWKDSDVTKSFDTGYTAALDAFFLRGQQEGVFRLDVAAPALTEVWFSVMTGLADAERRGRVAKAGLVGVLEAVILSGIEVPIHRR